MHAETLIAVVSCLAQLLEPAAPHAAAPESVEVRYARAQLQLAEANLKRVDQSNQRLARSVPSSVVAQYQRDVQLAQTRLAQTQLAQAASGQAANDFQIWLARAAAERQTAETAWKGAQLANSSVPGTFAPLDVERLRLRAEVAQLQLERGQALVGAGRETQLQWQLDLLQNQVQRLEEESRQPMPLVGYYPLWPW
jgi:hypothetical protein